MDDGSTDMSGMMLDDFVANIRDSFLRERFTIIHQSNRGVSAARNAALCVAKGEWVQFLDSDDSLELNFLEKLTAAIKANPNVDAVEHTAIYCYDDGRRVYGAGGRLPPAGVLTARQILSDPFGKKYTTLARCSCYKIFRRSVIERECLRFPLGMPIGEDILFAVKFYAYAGNIAVCPDVAGYCRIFRSCSALMTASAEKLIPCLRQMEELYDVWERRPSSGLAVSLSASILGAACLGKEFGKGVREQCLGSILSSRFFNRVGIPFLICHGSRKMRLFAFVYLLSPRLIRRIILKKL